VDFIHPTLGGILGELFNQRVSNLLAVSN